MLTRKLVSTKNAHTHTHTHCHRRLNRRLLLQLDDALSITSGTLPSWCEVLTKACPFLFELSSREKLVRCTAFGISHAMYWLQEEQVEEGAYSDCLYVCTCVLSCMRRRLCECVCVYIHMYTHAQATMHVRPLEYRTPCIGRREVACSRVCVCVRVL
jgi:hypothetical protein